MHLFLHFVFSKTNHLMQKHGSFSMGFRPKGCLVNPSLPSIPDFDSGWDVFRLRCSTFSKHGLAVFSRDLFTRHIWPLFWPWFDVTRFLVPNVGTNLSRVNMYRRRYFYLGGLLYVDFYLLVFSDWYFIRLFLSVWLIWLFTFEFGILPFLYNLIPFCMAI